MTKGRTSAIFYDAPQDTKDAENSRKDNSDFELDNCLAPPVKANCSQFWTLRLRATNQWNYFCGRCVYSFCHVKRQQNTPRKMWEIKSRVLSSSCKKRTKKKNSCFSQKRARESRSKHSLQKQWKCIDCLITQCTKKATKSIAYPTCYGADAVLQF